MSEFNGLFGMYSVPETTVPRLARRSSALLGLRITFSGLLCLLIVVLVGAAALNSETNLLFLLVGISMGVAIFSALAPLAMVRKVEVERIAPVGAIVGRPFTLGYTVRSRRRWLLSWSLVISEAPMFWRRERFPLGFIELLRPGQERRLELTAMCPRRGRVPLNGVRVTSRFPFGLFACSVDLALPGEIIVYPAVGRFRRDPWRDRRVPESASARHMRASVGAQEEFYGVREYRPGDNLRWIHWRRSARVGQLIVRESTPGRAAHLVVLLDPWPAMDRPVDEEPVERIISMAATAVCEGLEHGHQVGLIVRAAVPVVIPPSGGRPHRQRLLHELALLKPGTSEGLDALVSRIRWSSGWHGRCLLCATQHNITHSRLMHFLASRAESAIAAASNSETFDSLFEAAPQLLAAPSQPHKTAAAGRAR